jgi:hypothetical protein
MAEDIKESRAGLVVSREIRKSRGAVLLILKDVDLCW